MGWHINDRNLFLTVLKPEGLGFRCQYGHTRVMTLSWLADCKLLIVSLCLQCHPTPTLVASCLRGHRQRGPSLSPLPCWKVTASQWGREVCLFPDSADPDGVLAPLVAEITVSPSPSLGWLLPRKPGQPHGLCARQCWEPGSDMVSK